MSSWVAAPPVLDPCGPRRHSHEVDRGVVAGARVGGRVPGDPEFLREQLRESTSPRRVPAGVAGAKRAVFAIGSGQRTFTGIADRAGLDHGSLTRTLGVLVETKRVVRVDRPLSARPSRETHYQVAERVRQRWSGYRDRAVEPLVRACIERLLPRPEAWRRDSCRCVLDAGVMWRSTSSAPQATVPPPQSPSSGRSSGARTAHSSGATSLTSPRSEDASPAPRTPCSSASAARASTPPSSTSLSAPRT